MPVKPTSLVVQNVLITQSAVRGFLRVEKSPNEEQTFVLLGREVITDDGDLVVIVNRIMQVPNVHPDPSTNFTIDFDALPEQHRSRVVGVLHTHLAHHSRKPSPHDLMDIQQFPRLIGIVFHTKSRTATLYDAVGIIHRKKWDLDKPRRRWFLGRKTAP